MDGSNRVDWSGAGDEERGTPLKIAEKFDAIMSARTSIYRSLES